MKMYGFQKICTLKTIKTNYNSIGTGADPGGFLGSRDPPPPLQKYIKEAKRVIYWYKNTLKCIIS